MKEIIIDDFIDLDDALAHMEALLYENELHTEELDAEIKKINGHWRVGVTINGRQKEFDFGSNND